MIPRAGPASGPAVVSTAPALEIHWNQAVVFIELLKNIGGGLKARWQ
jgi:hypothetical protein